MDEGTILVYCCPSIFSLNLPPPSHPFQIKCTVYTDKVWLWGGGVELCCGPYSAGVLHSVSDQIQNLQNCFTTPNKMVNKDDNKGLMSIKFLRPCFTLYRVTPCRGWGMSVSGVTDNLEIQLIKRPGDQIAYVSLAVQLQWCDYITLAQSNHINKETSL